MRAIDEMKDIAKSDVSIAQFENEFKTAAMLAERFANELTRQVQELLDSNSVLLSFPIQQRVKTWESLREKLERKALALTSLRDLDDLVGLRLILQFKRDVAKVCSLIEQGFSFEEIRYERSPRQRSIRLLFDTLRRGTSGFVAGRAHLQSNERLVCRNTGSNNRAAHMGGRISQASI
jgi:ppGpp synthetase/RelA/SpoT-type nucleotidyltranferase